MTTNIISMPATQIEVNLLHAPYSIYIQQNVLQQFVYYQKFVEGRKVFILSQPAIADQSYIHSEQSYLDLVIQQFTQAGALTVGYFLVENGETAKSLAVTNLVYAQLIEGLYDRKSILVALGGGVVGDLGGYIAATFQRGIDFIQIPTSLLAMVDSSVGGKTGINHQLGKNLIGSFKQPKTVLIDPNFLLSLPIRELKAGLAEVIKYAILFDYDFFTLLLNQHQKILSNDLEILQQVISKCCQFKARVVINDETEQGERALLNLGHTFAHAIENFLGYGNWVHGEAVASGIVLAALYSSQYAQLAAEQAQQIIELIKLYQLNYWVPQNMEGSDFIKLMIRDKKSINRQINLILIHHIGECYIAKNQDVKTIIELITQHKIKYHPPILS